MPTKDPQELSPKDFERFVRELLDQEGISLEGYRSAHLETIATPDGSYTFDVTTRFRAFGKASFLVVIECKRCKDPIEREQVQALEMKRQAAAANKAMFFSTSRFRRGAIEFATAHNIALVQVKDGGTVFHALAQSDKSPYESWLPTYAGWLIGLDEEGYVRECSLGAFDTPFGPRESEGYLLEFLIKQAE